MIDLKLFRKDNNLLQKDLADYLGVSRGYIAMAETGKCELSEKQVSKLLANTNNWRTAALEGGQAGAPGAQKSVDAASSFELAVLRARVDLLERLLEEKERTIQILMNK